MNGHPTALLGAYLDGELGNPQARRVETHLADCESCSAELASLRTLSALLQESPSPKAPTAPERFVSQVGLRLPRRPAQPAWRRVLGLGWRLTPLGLLGAMAFAQAALLVSWLAVAVIRLGFAGDWLATRLSAAPGPWPSQLTGLAGANLSDAARFASALLRSGGPLGWFTTLNLFVLVAFGLMYWGWLATWLARRQRQRWQV